MHIERLALIAPELGRLHEFYGEILGLPIVRASEEILEIDAGSTRLVFRCAPIEGHVRYHFAFNIPENRLDEARKWLRDRVPIISSPDHGEVYDFRSWNAHAVYFYDPADNVLELIARHDLPNAAEVPFDSRQILCVSEIGFAADDVLAMVEELRTGAGVEPYRPGSDTFAPVGDENGLFIVVPRWREWFPNTGILADRLPTTVTLRGGVTVSS